MTKSAREKEAVLNVFAALMRPLMPVAFEYGISAAEIARVLRGAFIQALEARLANQNRPTTDARLAVVAGLPKSDVVSLREAARAGAPHSLSATVSPDQVGTLLSVWHTHSNFSGAYGLALELDLAPTPGSPRRSFPELVAIACPGADQEALLDELLAAGSVEVIDSTTVRCLSRAFVPKGADLKRIRRTSRFLGAVAHNFAYNLLRESPQPAYFERTVHSLDRVSEAGRDKFLALARERGQELLVELDTFLAHLAPADLSKAGKNYGVGVYFFEDQTEDGAADGDSDELEEKKQPAASPIEEIDVLAGVIQRK